MTSATAVADVTRLADDLESVRLLFPSSLGIKSIDSNIMERSTASARLYNSTPWSQRGDCKQRLSHVMTLPDLNTSLAMEVDHLNYSLLANSIIPSVMKLPSWADTCRTAQGKLAAARLIVEHRTWLEGFVGLLTATVPQLRLLMALPISPTGSNISSKVPFWQLWQLIIANSYVLVRGRMEEWPLHHIPANAPLFAALGTLMDLVLEVQRAPAGQKLWARFADTSEEWERNVQVVIRTPLQCMHHFVEKGLQPNVSSERLAVPSALVARVCCIACHQLRLELGQAWSAEPPPAWDCSTIGAVWSLLGRLFDCTEREACKAVMGAAGVEAIKLALLACVRYPPTLWRKYLSCPEIVITLLRNCMQADSSDGRGGGGGGGGRRGSISRGKGTDPVPATCVTDRQLLYTLRQCSILHPNCMYVVNTYMQDDSVAWEWPGQVPEDSPPILPPESVTRHLKLVINHVSLQTVVKMKHQRKAELARKQVTAAEGTPLRDRQQRLYALAAKAAVPTLAQSDSLQGLMLNLLEQAKDMYPYLDSESWLCASNERLLSQLHPGKSFSHQELEPLLRRHEHQRLHATYSLNHRAIHALGQLPGMFHMVEASIRSTTERPDIRRQVTLQAMSLMGNVQVSGSVTRACMAACVGLVSTLRKLRQLGVADWGAAHWRDFTKGGFEELSDMQQTLEVLEFAVTEVDFWVVEEGPLARHKPGSLISVGATHRLQVLALLSLTWAEEQNAFVRAMYEKRAEQRIPPPQPPVHHHHDACHTRLNNLMLGSLLQKGGSGGIPRKAAHQRQLAADWASFARTYLHGRLSPGCAHLGCTNLSGVSEASLPTQLCGGCRRVRYCSPKCQREAWVGDGHGLVCGKGEWAKEDAV